MSKVKIQGNASGTGVVTLTAPNTNTDRTITLPDGDISLGVGIDDNATSTAITIDASENTTFGGNIKIPAADSAALGLILNNTAGESVQMYYNGAGVNADFTINRTGSGAGDIVIKDTGEVILGGGISFNGDTAAANALDDYEEGTWTPTILGGTLTISSITKATYTKIGNVVTIQGYVNLNNDGNNTHCVISGLPFTSSNSELMLGGVTHDGGVLTDQKYLRVAHTATYFHIYKNGSSPAPQTDVDGSWFIFSVTYKT